MEPTENIRLNTRKVLFVSLTCALLGVAAGAYFFRGLIEPKNYSEYQAYVDELRDQSKEQLQLIDGLKNQAAQQNATIETLKNQINSSPVFNTASVAALESRINEIKARLDAQAPSKEATDKRLIMQFIAFDRLRSAIEQGKPYLQELTEIKGQLPSDALKNKVAMLDAHATTGIPSYTKLKEQFVESATQAVQEGSKVSKPGLTDKVKENMTKLVTVRKVGKDQQGSDDQAIIARAEAATNEENLSQALQELTKLSKSSAKAFSKWIESASARNDAQTVLSQLKDGILDSTKAQ